MKKYNYTELIEKDITTLNKIRASKQNELYEIKKEKEMIVSNILSIQSMCEQEIKKIKGKKK